MIIMLRNRSRAVTSKQVLMTDHTSQPSSHTKTHSRSRTPTFLDSPRFKAFTQKKGFSENDGLVSPTSILDAKPFFSLTNPFKNPPRVTFPGNKQHSWDEKPEAKGIGLVLDDPLDQNEVITKGNNNRLRVQIPALISAPTEFGIKTRGSHVSTASGSANPGGRSRDFVCVDRHSEDYTCVIAHGPIPRTTHIFDNCVVETHCCLSDHYNSNKFNYNFKTKKPKSSSEIQPQSFLSFCHTCKKNLQQKIDIYIYRGEKAFCSRECRYKEMILDGMGIEEIDDHSIRDCF